VQFSLARDSSLLEHQATSLWIRSAWRVKRLRACLKNQFWVERATCPSRGYQPPEPRSPSWFGRTALGTMAVSPRSGRLVADRDRLVACATLFSDTLLASRTQPRRLRMSTAKAEPRRPTGVGCSELLGAVFGVNECVPSSILLSLCGLKSGAHLIGKKPGGKSTTRLTTLIGAAAHG